MSEGATKLSLDIIATFSELSKGEDGRYSGGEDEGREFNASPSCGEDLSKV